MSEWTKKEATARALEMDSYYQKTGLDGYRYERDKWYEIARDADDNMRGMQTQTIVQGTGTHGFSKGLSQDTPRTGEQDEA